MGALISMVFNPDLPHMSLKCKTMPSVLVGLACENKQKTDRSLAAIFAVRPTQGEKGLGEGEKVPFGQGIDERGSDIQRDLISYDHDVLDERWWVTRARSWWSLR